MSYYYVWVSQVALIVKNPPANAGDMRHRFDPWVWEDPLEEGMATHSSILAQRIPKDRGAWRATVHEVTESDTTEATQHAHTIMFYFDVKRKKKEKIKTFLD